MDEYLLFTCESKKKLVHLMNCAICGFGSFNSSLVSFFFVTFSFSHASHQISFFLPSLLTYFFNVFLFFLPLLFLPFLSFLVKHFLLFYFHPFSLNFTLSFFFLSFVLSWCTHLCSTIGNIGLFLGLKSYIVVTQFPRYDSQMGLDKPV